ncbi:MAG: hypothetical protein U9Q07_14750 [Planctomycetota bacterium]|nr:hypothetical protein [Planctomycetota bacterium]
MTEALAALESALKTKGFHPIKSGASTVKDRDYALDTSTRTRNQRSGGIGSGVVAVERRIQVIINFTRKTDRKQLQTIWNEIDAVVGATAGRNELVFEGSDVDERSQAGIVAYIDYRVPTDGITIT